MQRKFILDYETVDNITKGNLLEIYSSMVKDLENNASGERKMHTDDVEYYTNMLPALAQILDYFGEKVG